MPLWPDAILLDGHPLPLGSVLADLTIHHGRQTLADEPTASTCQITLADVAPAFVQAFHVGAELVVTVSDGVVTAPRFRGRVTDASLDVDELTIIAAGRLSTLRQYEIGAGSWPVETWSARMRRIFEEAGLADVLDLRPDPEFDPPVAGRDPATAGTTTLADYLAYLAPMVGASVSDYFSTDVGGNLLPNGGFEVDVAPWRPDGDIPGGVIAIARDSAWSSSGAASLRITAPEHDPVQWAGTYHPPVAVAPGASTLVVSATFYVHGPAQHQFYFRLLYWDATLSNILKWDYSPSFYPQPGEPFFHAYSSAVPAGAVNVDLLVYGYSATGHPHDLALDDVVVQGIVPAVDAPAAVLVQALGGRRLDALAVVDPADVVYAPVWEQVLPDGNIVTVRYTGDQSQSVTVQDDASIDLYGRLPRTIDTTFTAEADARTRANEALARGAFPRWNIREAPAIRGLPLDVGAPVELSNMPASSPFPVWTPVLEGWTDSLTADVWTMRLALSDPYLSGLVLPWDAIPAPDPAYQWDTIDPATDWTEALTLAALRLEVVHAR